MHSIHAHSNRVRTPPVIGQRATLEYACARLAQVISRMTPCCGDHGVKKGVRVPGAPGTPGHVLCARRYRMCAFFTPLSA
eukprot:12657783-Heterocapsa_arctica.AAC.1